MDKIAEQIKWLDDFTGTAALFRLTPPIVSEAYDGVLEVHEYVVVSAANAPFSGPETYIFPADERGNVTNWGELEGSYRGSLDITAALRNAGYVRQAMALPPPSNAVLSGQQPEGSE